MGQNNNKTQMISGYKNSTAVALAGNQLGLLVQNIHVMDITLDDERRVMLFQILAIPELGIKQGDKNHTM